jgi:signal transduction histidine kinase
VATTLTAIQGLLRRADRQIDRLTRLVNDLLDDSRIQGHGLELRLEPCDLAAIVHEAVEEHRQAAPTRTIRLDVSRGEAVPVIADADRIRQVLINYLTNALTYSRPDQPIDVGLQTDGGIARVWVHDEGPGVPAADRDRIWEGPIRSRASSRRAARTSGWGSANTSAAASSNTTRDRSA